jgi:hypothetical protein
MNVRASFEDELRKRGVAFHFDAESGRHSLDLGGGHSLISLENLQRDCAEDGDFGRVSRFVDAIMSASCASEDALTADQLYWCLEPGEYEERADFRVEVSKRVDRVLAHLSTDCRLITWVTPAMLEQLNLSEAEAGARAFANLARALGEAKLEFQDIDGVRLGYIATSLPFKASLILAPNLRKVVGTVLGWPLSAVVPDRNFLYLWAAQHSDFVQRVGRVVVREFSRSSYPISTEVFEITHLEVRAIGEFPTGG